jgi:hypothetical protein
MSTRRVCLFIKNGDAIYDRGLFISASAETGNVIDYYNPAQTLSTPPFHVYRGCLTIYLLIGVDRDMLSKNAFSLVPFLLATLLVYSMLEIYNK